MQRPDAPAATVRYRVAWENRMGSIGGNESVAARSERQARRWTRRRHGLLIRITKVEADRG